MMAGDTDAGPITGSNSVTGDRDAISETDAGSDPPVGPAADVPSECDDVTVNESANDDQSWAPPRFDGRAEITSTTAERATASGSIEWPFDSVTSALEWWYRPAIEARTWLSLGYLFVGVILGPLLFAATLVTVLVVGALSLVGIGLLLVVPAFALINALAALERNRASWIGEPIAPRQLQRGGKVGWSVIGTRLGDAARWRQVSFLLLYVVTGPVFFVVGFVPWSALLSGPFGFEFGGFSFGGLILSAVLLGAAPRITRFVAELFVSFASWFLGPDPSTDLEERVEALSSQRDQILDAVAGERRRIERNLHDGVQQQLVALGIDIGRAHARLDNDPEGAKELLGDAREKVRGSIGELRLIGRGLHPAVLSDRGLDAALSAVVANAPIPISVTVSTERELPTDVAETSYYIVNEAVANVLKHARARTASVRVTDEPGLLPAIRITVHDDGQGGADAAQSTGSGLAGMAARVAGVDGAFDIASPRGGPTTLTAVIPIRRPRSSPEPRSSISNEGHLS